MMVVSFLSFFFLVLTSAMKVNLNLPLELSFKVLKLLNNGELLTFLRQGTNARIPVPKVCRDLMLSLREDEAYLKSFNFNIDWIDLNYLVNNSSNSLWCLNALGRKVQVTFHEIEDWIDHFSKINTLAPWISIKLDYSGGIGLIDTNELLIIQRALESGWKLDVLDLSYCNIDDDDAVHVVKMIPFGLKELNLQGNFIREGGKSIAKELMNSQVRRLVLNENPIDDNAVRYIAKVLKANKLEYLELESTDITDFSGVEIGKALQGNSVLKELRLGSNFVSHFTAIEIAKGLNDSLSGLQVLDLSETKINNVGGKAIGMSLKNNKNLRELLLYNCGIVADAAKSIANGLIHNQSLKRLDLGDNLLGDQGAEYIAKCIERSNLIDLDLSYAGIGARGAYEIGRMLKNMSGLVSLNLCGNEILSNSLKSFGKSIVNHPSLETLDLTDNSIDYQGALYLAEGLQENSVLRNLYIGENLIGNIGVQAFALALERNTGLKYIDLKHNRFSDSGALALYQSLTRSGRKIRIGFIKNEVHPLLIHLLDYLQG
jgi:Ran GTPase-activating protein (RanGAP) involved in mRNA processing and transport